MELIDPTDVDFAEFYAAEAPSAKVRPASAFLDEFKTFAKPRAVGQRDPHMFSTKLGTALEFRPAEVTVWAGYNGHRKSLFTGQVALDLCVQNQPTLLASFEMLPGRTLHRMAKQAYGMHEISAAKADEFSAWTDGRLWMLDHLGQMSPRETLAVLRFFADRHKGAQVFIDSMMMVVGSEENLDEQKAFMTDVVRTAQETGLHIHLVAHCRKPINEDKPPTKYDIKGSGSISDQAFNVVMIWANKAKTEALNRNPSDEDWLVKPDAIASLEKQRNGSYEGKFGLWFDDASLRFSNDRTSAIEPYELRDLLPQPEQIADTPQAEDQAIPAGDDGWHLQEPD